MNKQKGSFSEEEVSKKGCKNRIYNSLRNCRVESFA
jgi:hypothetical protein